MVKNAGAGERPFFSVQKKLAWLGEAHRKGDARRKISVQGPQLGLTKYCKRRFFT